MYTVTNKSIQPKMNPFDDMALARATAERNGYHQRSPSLMVVIPLEDHDGLYCDDLNASYFEFFQEYDPDENNPQQRNAYRWLSYRTSRRSQSNVVTARFV